mgnify:CR=1 FL=1
MENSKLKALLKECVEEQEKIGMHHFDEITISFNNVTKTKTKCSNNTIARAYTDSNGKRSIILTKLSQEISYFLSEG